MAAAAVLAAAVLLVALAYLPGGGVDTGPPAAETEVALRSPRPPSAARVDPTEPASGTADEVAGEEYAVPPCDRCLDEAGALDVAETFLYHMRADYIDVRAVLYSDIGARLEAAGLPPPHETGLPKLPPGLVDAPADYSVSNRRLPKVGSPGETWVVWLQTGWVTKRRLDLMIGFGQLPPVAASWPPIKLEREFLLVDGRTGAVDMAGMWGWPLLLREREQIDTYGQQAFEEAATRAEHWIGKRSGDFDE